MGNCMGGEQSRGGYSSYYLNDHELYQHSDIFKPLPTSLFNTLRRPNDVALITGSASSLAGEVDLLRIDFQKATPSSLKTLLNFKKIVFIGSQEGEGEGQIKKVKANVSFTKFYVVAQAVFQKFLQDYPIFAKTNWEKHQMVTNKLPLLLVDSNEFVNTTEPRIRVFIHASNKRDSKIYALLGINDKMVIKEAPEGSTPQHTKAYYVDALNNSKETTIVVLHSQTMQPTDILEIVAIVLREKYKIPINQSQIYLKRNLPNNLSTKQLPSSISAEEPIFKTATTVVSGPQKYRKLFQKLQGESSEEKTERAYNLLSTLLINIYSNPNEDSYREVKRANRQLNDLLIKHKSGLKLLDELGFREKDEHWVNTVESKYLKIYKTDLDLGFKKYKAREEDE